MMCAGTCGRGLRGQRVPAADAPGTVVLASKGLCMSCYRHAKGQSMGRVDSIRRRQDVAAIVLPVNVTPATMAAARAKVMAWFPGDTELLDIIGIPA